VCWCLYAGEGRHKIRQGLGLGSEKERQANNFRDGLRVQREGKRKMEKKKDDHR